MYNDILNKLKSGKLNEAEKLANKFYTNNPNNSNACFIMGMIFHEKKRFNESLNYFYEAVKIEKNIRNYFAYGDALLRTEKIADAINYYKKILKIDSLHEPTLVNLHYAYFLTNDYPNAEKHILKAIKINSKNPHYFKNLGNLYRRQNKLVKALKNYKLALNLDKKNVEIKKAIGLVLLTQKNYKDAWSYYESRIYARQHIDDLFNIIKNNLFKNKSILSKDKIAIISEQGIGDHILFASIYNELIKLNNNIIFIIDQRLNEIFNRSFKNCKFINKDNFKQIKLLKESGYSFLYAGSLGKYFRNNIKDFSGNSFLIANKDKKKYYESYLKKYNYKKYVGISWKSKSKYVGQKSLNLNDFQRLFKTTNVGFVNLQYGDIEDLNQYNKTTSDKIINIEDLDLYNSIDDVLSIIDCLDMVITSPSLNTHLAGSLGIKCATLFPYEYSDIMNSDLYNGNSEWYKSLKIYQIKNNLQDIINNIKNKLI